MDPLDAIQSQIGRAEYAKAKCALGAFLQQNWGSIAAWSLLASLVSDPAQQADRYRQILALEPGNAKAADALQCRGGAVGASTLPVGTSVPEKGRHR
jgi:hypothetical protein